MVSQKQKEHLFYKSTLIVVCVLFLGLGFTACSTDNSSKRIKLAHGHDISHPVHEGIVFMAKRVNEISNGKLQVDIYPSQQLGSEREVVELLQIGSLGMTKVSSATMENFVPDFKVYGLPYLFENEEHMYNVLDGEIGQNMLLAADKFRLRGLCYYDAGSRSFYTKDRPIETPQDLKGLKIRVMESNTSMNMVKALGGSPTPISYGELYTALQQGVVDAAENNAPSLYSSRHYEVCKYYSLDEHSALPDLLIISTVVWNRLNEQEQAWLTQAVKESIPFQRKVWAESVEESLRAMEAAGVKINYPDKSKFVELVQPLYDSYRSSAPHLYEIIEKIKALAPKKDV